MDRKQQSKVARKWKLSAVARSWQESLLDGRFQPPPGQAIEQEGPYLGAGRAVVAVYDNDIIYLSDGWRGGSPADESVLIHEMVHHLQKHAQLRYGCPQEREKLAYQAQERWLTRFGATLRSEFEIDPMTLLLHSACLH